MGRRRGLQIHWDVAEGLFPAGVIENGFAAFVNSLAAVGLYPDDEKPTYPLNELQKAYFVPLTTGNRTGSDGCQVYLSFHLQSFDLNRLEAAWLGLLARHGALRTFVTTDGQLGTLRGTPDQWCIPVIRIKETDNSDDLLTAIREEMSGHGFSFGRWPQLEIRVTQDHSGRATVHCAISLLIVDGRSIHLLLRELFRLYVNPGSIPPASGPARYSDRRLELQPAPRDPAALQYWQRKFSSLPPGPLVKTELSTATERHRVRMEGRIRDTRALKAVAREAGVSPNVILLAALAEVWSSRLHEPFSLAVVRWRPEDERFRPGEYTALGWIKSVDGSVPLLAKAAAYQAELERDEAAGAVNGLGELRKVVMKRRRSGDFGFPVVYTSVLDLTAFPLPPGISAGPWMTCTPDVSLDCIAMEEGDEIRYWWDAVEKDFPDGMLKELFAKFQRTLDEPGVDAVKPASSHVPTAGVERIQHGPSNTLSDAERHKILYEWNNTAVDFPDRRPAHLLFEDRVREFPNGIALRWRGGTMSFAALNQMANRIAWKLRRMGVVPETMVGVSVRRSPAMVAAILGVLKAGGAYVPVEPWLPEARARVMMEEAGTKILLTTSDTRCWSAPAGIDVIKIDSVANVQESASDSSDPQPVCTTQNTAYVIFTSGSTGKPKGVAVAHRAINNLLHWCYRTFNFGKSDVGLAVASLGFDLSVFDLFGVLGAGASLYLADEEQQKDPQLLLDVLLDEPITFWNSAPATLNQLAPLLPRCRDHAGTNNLRLVFLSGDYTPLSLPGDLRAIFRKAQIISLGGATEATVWSNFYPVGEIDPDWHSIPYGRPIDNSRYYILDSSLEPCPVNVEGDLYIAGECLSLGYVNQPILTAERFIREPFVDEPGARMYKTGDRAAYFPDGNICFLGRADNQVKIRGFRVELGEIEHCLRKHPAVKDAVVIARGENTGDRKLVAYVVPASGCRPSVKELRSYTAESLPEYMVPNFVAVVRSFPLNSSGKLDRNALPWPIQAPTPERSNAEHLCAEISALFCKFLGVEQINVDQDLWDQGASSFTMVQVSNALRSQYQQRIPVSALVSKPTVSGIAGHLAEICDVRGASETKAASTPSLPSDSISDSHAPGSSFPSDTALKPSPRVSSEKSLPQPSDQPTDAAIEFFSAEERAAFKQARHNLRPTNEKGRIVPLNVGSVAPEHYAWRGSCRNFADRQVSSSSLGRLLGLLRKTSIKGQERFLFPSAGDTYSVQTYVVVRPGGVEGIAEGIYYYNPYEHALHAINDRPHIDRSIHFYYNRPLFDQARFELYLIGNKKGIEPIYRQDSERFLLLEAGYMGQLLMMGQAACQIGLCPIGSMAYERVRSQFDLSDEHCFLHAFLGGVFAHPKQALSTGERPFLAERNNKDRRPEATAIIGMAGRYPDAGDPDELWRNLVAGKCSIGALPEGRQPGKRDSDRASVSGGFLPDIDRFDALLFHISPQEAAVLDPQMRLLLQTVWECLENAGYTSSGLARTAPRVGVFLGYMWSDYQHVGADEWAESGNASVSGSASDIANRISHYFDFRGPSLAVNTSCSSSLAALHLAVESLRRGECDAALVGAVNLFSHPYHMELLSGLNLVAGSPAPGAFDGGSTGWSPGEGAGAVLLRPVSSAIEHHDFIHGVVEATSIGHSGHSSRFGTVDAQAVADSISDMLAGTRLTPKDIHYVECAATGASLADAAETEALHKTFHTAGVSVPVPVGTLKPNIGHLEAASGISQLTKVLLQLKHRQIAPTLISKCPSPLIAWEGLSIRPAGRVESWEGTSGPRRALINAIGATGNYGHVLVSEPPSRTIGKLRPDEHAVVLSAESENQLLTLAARLCDHLRGQMDDPAFSLADIAFTLQTGRIHLTHRLAALCKNLKGLIAALDAFLRKEPCQGLYTGVRDRNSDDAKILPPTQKEAVTLWLRGAAIQWDGYWDASASRVPLPTYPFAQEAYWIGELQTSSSVIPPLVEADSENEVRIRAEEYLKQIYSEVSGIPAEKLHSRVPLEDYGLNSQLVMRLNSRLERDFGRLSRTLFFEFRNLSGVAAHLMSLPQCPWRSRAHSHARGPEPVKRAETGKPSQTPLVQDDIAIIGIAGRFPHARNVDEFWQNLQQGRDSITDFPAARRRDGWPTHLMRGGFLDDVDCFDPLFFNITPRDAKLMDPQERLFLEVVWEALEDAGYTRARLQTPDQSKVGVYVGLMHYEYPFFGVELSQQGTTADAGSCPAGVANRVSYFLGLRGPSMAVDTMCSSSLTSIHLAVEALRRGECALAIAGGANLSLHPNKFIQARRLHTISSDGRCHSFGADASGYVPGEGVAAILLKPLQRAIADGDIIHAIIKATAVNHGGKTNGYTVPSPASQGDLVCEALQRARIDAGTISYLEAHGAGTVLGDPIEIEGLLRAFSAENLPPRSCAIGSVKTNIGHLEGAAGITGLIKVVLQMKHKRLVPSLHAEKLNPNIDWDKSPFFVQRTLGDWPARPSLPKRAGISSFGAGGSNAHVILESHEAQTKPRRPATTPHLIVLSARDEDRLKASAGKLAAFLRQHSSEWVTSHRQIDNDRLLAELARIAKGELPAALSGRESVPGAKEIGSYLMDTCAGTESSSHGQLHLEDVAFTLQTGREPLKERLAFVVSDFEELCGRLEQYCSGEVAGIFRGHVVEADVVPPFQGAEADLARIGQHWVSGGSVDWTRLHQDRDVRRIHLPSYPFAKMRCWLDEPARPARAVAPSKVPVFEKGWVLESAAQVKQFPAAGPVLCLFHSGSESIAQELARIAGPDQVVLVREGGPAQDQTLAFGDEATAARVIERLLESRGSIHGWIDLCDVYRTTPDSGSWAARLGMLQRLLSSHSRSELRLLHLTQGLQNLPGARPDLAGARMAALIRSLPGEYRRITSILIDTDASPDQPSLFAEQILSEWSSRENPGEICYRAGHRYRSQLNRVTLSAQHELVVDPSRSYVITGGTRGLGALAAQFLVRRGARKLALMGIQPLPPRNQWPQIPPDHPSQGTMAQIRKLEDAGAQVMLFTGSLADRHNLAEFLDRVRSSLGELGGVIHCAGYRTPGHTSFALKDLREIKAVFEPKVEGVEVLAELCSADKLSFFVLFSSISAVAPQLAAGVIDYAAANGYMDFFAGFQARTGRNYFHSINWPAWRESGSGRAAADFCAHMGIDSIDDEEGLAVLEQIASVHSHANLIPCPAIADKFDPQALLQVRRTPGPETQTHTGTPLLPADAPAPWLVDLFEDSLQIPRQQLDPGRTFDDFGVESVMLAELLRKIEQHVGRPLEPGVMFDNPTLEQLSKYLAQFEKPRTNGVAPSAAPLLPADAPAPWLVDLFEDSLQIPRQQLDPGRTFDDFGVESVMLAELLRKIEQHVGRPLEPGVMFDNPTLEQLSKYLAQFEKPRTNGLTPGAAPAVVRTIEAENNRIAVIGVACRFPGAENIESFWENLVTGRCSVVEVPASRWDKELLYHPEHQAGKSISKWGGFVDGIELFDPAYFGITEAEATYLDPAVRQLLECTVACFHNAGYPTKEFWGRDVGVFVGARMSNYRLRAGIRSGSSGLGMQQNFIAARLAHQFNFYGPNLVVDSACSSSLVSVQLACRSLLAGESEVAIAGGVDVLLDEKSYLEFSAAKAISPSGRCAVFDEHADGFVPGEGSGLILLKPLQRALQDGDPIHAVINAVAVNNDGHTMGMTSPSSSAQSRVVRQALRASGFTAEQIAMIEAHGTGTMIGDPIELRALTDVFRETTRKSGFCAIGSVKSNQGHLLLAAGIAGLLKAILSVERAQIPATLFCNTPNPRFEFASSPFFPNTKLRPWPADQTVRVAGVSSFGLGGTNAHAIVSELERSLRERFPQQRAPLPAPVFQRKRFWLEREPVHALAPGSATSRPATAAGRVSSILQLNFEPARNSSPATRVRELA